MRAASPLRFIFPEPMEVHRRSFLEHLKIRSYSRTTMETYSGCIGHFYRFLLSLGIEDVREVERKTIQAYQSWLMEKRGYAIRSVHSKLVSLRRFFEHLEKNDALLVNPCVGMILPKLKRQLPRNLLTRAEVKRMFEVIDTQTGGGIRDRAILEIFYSNGIRLEEMIGLTVHDIDFRNGFLRVNKGKFAKDRVVPLGRKACAYVREYLEEVRSRWSRRNREEQALWLNAMAPYRPMGKAAISVMLHRYGRRAGIPKSVSAHVWRHLCATYMVAGGSNIVQVQKLLGHRSLATTQIYTQVHPREMMAAWKRGHPRAKAEG